MESVEVSAKSVDEAIDIALDELGLKLQQVHIEILTSGKPGLFGIGGEQARVRVTALEEGTARPISEPEYEAEEVSDIEIKDIESPEVDLAADYLTQLLSFMEIDAETEVRPPETPGDGLGRASAVLDVSGDDLGLLIGRRGTTLAALQYMVNLMVSRKTGSRVLISVDVEHYRRRREESLRGRAPPPAPGGGGEGQKGFLSPRGSRGRPPSSGSGGTQCRPFRRGGARPNG